MEVTAAPAARLLPSLAEVYRAEMTLLQAALNGDDASAVRERVRAPIDEIRLVPLPTDQKAPLQVEVRGQLAVMLALGLGGTRAPSFPRNSGATKVGCGGTQPPKATQIYDAVDRRSAFEMKQADLLLRANSRRSAGSFACPEADVRY